MAEPMSITPAFQAFLATHATEPDALAALFQDAEAVLGGSGLSEDEKTMVREWNNDAGAHPPPPNCPWSIHHFTTGGES
jgi:hypothetical protein